jgi:transcription initiation factor TFIIB
MKTSIICSICNKKEGQAVTDPESGELICSNCGMVMVETVSENRSEWRAFKTEERTKEVVQEHLLP